MTRRAPDFTDARPSILEAYDLKHPNRDQVASSRRSLVVALVEQARQRAGVTSS